MTTFQSFGSIAAKIVAALPEPDAEPRVPATPRELDEDDEVIDPDEHLRDEEDAEEFA